MQGQNAISQAEHGAPAAKKTNRLIGLIQSTEQWYRKHRLDEDVRNLSYYRGQFWAGDGISAKESEMHNYAAQQNEIFPVVDTVVSSLAMGTPAVEPVDQRFYSTEIPDRKDDLTISGRRIGSVLNYWAEEDMLDTATQEMVLHCELFGIGVVKTSWSPTLGRPIWRTRLPWEWHCDPGAKRMGEISWCFERFTIHINDIRARMEPRPDGSPGPYIQPKKSIKANTYPRTMIDQKLPQQEELKLREMGLREYVSLVEFWDFRARRMYHIHVETGQILLDAAMPYGRPYEALVFHDFVGHIRGIADVTLLAANQRDVNELVSARREIVRRLPRRMLMDRALWRDDGEFERWKNSRTWEPTLADFPSDGSVQDKVWVSPEMPTTFDFNHHLEQTVQTIRWTTGLADFQRGEVTNIRTAAEATMVRSSVEGRMHIRTTKVVRAVSSLFKQAITVWKWATANPAASGIDMNSIAELTQGDSDATVLINDIRKQVTKFRLLPFSPLMEDKHTRREQINLLLPALSKDGPLAASINQHELAREICDLYGLRPSIVLKEPSAPPMDPSAMAGMPPDMPMDPAAGVPPAPQMPPTLTNP